MKTFNFLVMFIIVTSCCNLITEGNSGSGNVTREVREITSFNTLNLAVVFDVLIIPSDSEKVIVETDDNLQELVLVENDGETLIVKMKPESKICKKTRGKVFIYSKEIKGITNSSVGMLENEGILKAKTLRLNNSSVGKTVLKIEADELTINNSAVGNTELSGSCNDLILKNSAVGELNAIDLHCNNLDLDNKSVGKTTVFVNNECNINNSAVGSLDIYGKGVVKNISNTGIGKFQKH